jgi:hypothetical protein
LGGAFLRGPVDAVGKRLVGRWDVNLLDLPGFKMRKKYFGYAGMQ